MSVEELLNEFWTRIMFETMDMDADSKYLTRGVVQSVIHDIRETHKLDGVVIDE